MPIPCEQAAVIEAQGKKIDTILDNQEKHANSFNSSLEKLTAILLENVRHQEAITQLKKESDLHFSKDREIGVRVEMNNTLISERLTALEREQTRYDSGEITKKVKELYVWYLEEKGWRRFVPAAMALVSGFMAIYIGLQTISNHSERDKDWHQKIPSVGVDK